MACSICSGLLVPALTFAVTKAVLCCCDAALRPAINQLAGSRRSTDTAVRSARFPSTSDRMAQPNLSSELLRTFIAVVEAGGFIRAAEQLHKTQSTISQQIQRLELETACSLFRSEGRRRVLTAEGEMMLGYARRMLALQEDAIGALLNHQQQGSLRLGVSPSLVDGALPALLARFSRHFPGVALQANTDYSEPLLQGLRRGDYDLILTLSLEKPDDRACLLYSEAISWIGSPVVVLEADGVLPLASLNAPCLFRQCAIDALNRAGLPWREVYTTSSNSSLMAAVGQGLAISARPISAVRYGAQPLTQSWLPPLPTVYILVQASPQSRVAQTLAEQLRDKKNGMF